MSKLKIKDLNTVANVYQIPTTGTGATITGSLEGDVIVIDGNSSAYTIKASGSKVTISGINDFGKKFTVTVTFDKSKAAVAQTAKFAFADGTVELGYNPTTKTVTSGGTPVGKASVGVSTLPVDNTVTADSFEGSDGSAPALGKTFTLTNGLDNIAGTGGADTLFVGNNGDLSLVDTVVGGAGNDTLVLGNNVGIRDADFTNVSSVEVVKTAFVPSNNIVFFGDETFVELGANAAAAGVNTLILQGLAQSADLDGFNKAITVTGSQGADFVNVNVADAGNKALNLGADYDTINLDGATEDKVTVSLVSADAGSGTGTIKIDGANGDITTGNAAIEIRADGEGESVSVKGSDAAGNLIANEDRGDFNVVVVATSGNDDFTQQKSLGFGNESYYVNLGAGNDKIDQYAFHDARNFIVGGTGNDEITVGGSGLSVVRAGADNDTVNVEMDFWEGEDGQQDIDLGAGTNEVTFDAGSLQANQKLAPAATIDTLNDTVKGGAGVDTLRASSSDLNAVSAAGAESGTVQTISGIEVLSITNALTGAITLGNIQTGLKTVALENGIFDSATIATGAGSATINLLEEINQNFSGNIIFSNTINVVGAEKAAGDTVTIANKTEAVDVFVEGMITPVKTSQDAFDDVFIRSNDVETLVLDGTGTGAATTQNVGLISLSGSQIGTEAAPANATTTVKFVGSNAFSVGFFEGEGSIDADVVDASGLTGANGLSAATNALSIIGSAGNDNLVFLGSTKAAVPAEGNTPAQAAVNATINAGNGTNTITINGAGGNGTINVVGGTGVDTLNIGFRGDSKLNVNLGGGSDVVKASLAINGTDTIDAGAGTDTLQLSLVGSANVGAFSNFEVFDAKGLNVTLDVDILAAKNTVTEFITSGDITASGTALSNIGAGVGFRVTDGINHSITLTQKVAGAQSVTLDIDQTALTNESLNDGVSSSGIVLANATTANVVFDSSFAQEMGDITNGTSSLQLSALKATVANVTSGGANSNNSLRISDAGNSAEDTLAAINVTGSQKLELLTSGLTKLSTVDASASTGGLVFNSAALANGGSVKLGSGTDKIDVTNSSTAIIANSVVTGFESIAGFEKTAAVSVSVPVTEADAMAKTAAIAAADKLSIITSNGPSVADDLDVAGGSVANGVLTFSGQGPTTLAGAVAIADMAANAAEEALIFEYVGNSYVFVQGAPDTLVQLVGITGVKNFVEDGVSNDFFIV